MVKMFTSKIVVAVLVASLAMPLMLSRTAAAADGPKNAITVNPLGFIGWGPDIEYERMMGGNGALAIRGKFGGWSLGDWSNSALGGGISYRWFLQEENYASGLWVGPSVDILSITSEFLDEDAVTSMIYSIYGQLGYKWLMGKKIAFVISPYINLGYNMGELSVTTSTGVDETASFNGIAFGIGLAIGLAF